MTVKLTKLEMNIFHLFFLYGHLIFIIYRIITNNYISNTVVCAFSKENLPFHKKNPTQKEVTMSDVQSLAHTKALLPAAP